MRRLRWMVGLFVLGATVLPASLRATAVTAPISAYFDAPASGQSTYSNSYRVVGSLVPVSWSWGRIELLEGYQKFRNEAYNLRTEKLRYQDTWWSSQYPTRTYFGELNQEIVDGFNLYYQDNCASAVSTEACPSPGPTRPEARFALLHVGPATAAGQCDTKKPPMLLVHGSATDANTWLWPFGNDGDGNTYPFLPDTEGMVFALERQKICTYAVTFGNFHGDNFGQATQVSNSIKRIKALTGAAKVDVLTWSKGALAVDAYLTGAAGWTGWGSGYFEQLAQAQAKEVPPYANDVRGYFSLSGAHLGIDMTWRHPFPNLSVVSSPESLSRGPISWGAFMAVQCVTWGYYSSPDSPYWPDPYAYSVCENRGATWPDFWKWIYTSNITGLDADGHPLYSQSLKQLNVRQGVSSTAFNFDAYDLAIWGAVDEQGRYVNPFLGQAQASWDFRDYYPVEYRDHENQDWYWIDSDEYNWYAWLELKIEYDPYTSATDAGWLVDASHRDCRETAFEPSTFPCLAVHTQVNRRTAESIKNSYGTYKLLDGLGIFDTMEAGGFFVERLKARSLPQLDYLYVLYGTELNPPAIVSEIDGMDCPDCAPHSDGVVFDVSIAARDQLTKSWDSAWRNGHSSQEGVATYHLYIGADPQVYTLLLNKIAALNSL